MNEFRICNICRGVPFEKLKKELETLDPQATIQVGCQNVCGIGRMKPFVIVNKKLIVDETLEGLMEKVKQEIK